MVAEEDMAEGKAFSDLYVDLVPKDEESSLTVFLSWHAPTAAHGKKGARVRSLSTTAISSIMTCSVKKSMATRAPH